VPDFELKLPAAERFKAAEDLDVGGDPGVARAFLFFCSRVALRDVKWSENPASSLPVSIFSSSNDGG
jgi:hypothetical protein